MKVSVAQKVIIPCSIFQVLWVNSKLILSCHVNTRVLTTSSENNSLLNVWRWREIYSIQQKGNPGKISDAKFCEWVLNIYVFTNMEIQVKVARYRYQRRLPCDASLFQVLWMCVELCWRPHLTLINSCLQRIPSNVAHIQYHLNRSSLNGH